MGFPRNIQPPPQRDLTTIVIRRLIAEQAAFVARRADPFGIDDPCPLNPTGHQPHSSCGETVCFHCAKVFWR